MFVRILTACKRGVNGGASSCEPFRFELTQATFALASQSSALHGSCQPMEGRSLRAYRSGSVKGHQRWNARPLARRRSRHGDRRSLDTLARAVLLQRSDPISKQEQQTSSKPAESFSARALSSLSWLMHATRASRLQKRRVQRKDHASSRWKDYILTRRQSRELTTLRALNSFGLRSC